MEAFESFVALTMEADTEDGRLVVSEAIKFPVVRHTAKASHVEFQTHGFEVDLVGARQDKLVLATVKSFFGSRGVVAEHVMGKSQTKRLNSLYALLNDPVVRAAVVDGASQRFGYPIDQIELRLYVGKFAGGKIAEHERLIREWAATQIVGAGPIRVFGLQDIVTTARRVASSKTYRDNPALVAMKVMDAAGMLIPNEHPRSRCPGRRSRSWRACRWASSSPWRAVLKHFHEIGKQLVDLTGMASIGVHGSSGLAGTPRRAR